MPDFHLVPGPILAPGRCGGCGRAEGEMVDLMIRPDDPALSPYLCTVCVHEAARLVGCWDPVQVESAGLELVALDARVAALETELEAEKQNKVLTVADAIRFADWRAGSGSSVTTLTRADLDNTAAKGPHFEAPKCSATRADGRPCTATALPGRDVCLSHSRRPVAA